MWSRLDSLVFTVKISDLNSKASNYEKSCKHFNQEASPICTCRYTWFLEVKFLKKHLDMTYSVL
jgi:hypothetical protein